jgi:hypothetical protein
MKLILNFKGLITRVHARSFFDTFSVTLSVGSETPVARHTLLTSGIHGVQNAQTTAEIFARSNAGGPIKSQQ